MTLPLETVVVQLQTQPQGADERRSAAQLAAQLWRTGLWKVRNKPTASTVTLTLTLTPTPTLALALTLALTPTLALALTLTLTHRGRAIGSRVP